MVSQGSSGITNLTQAAYKMLKEQIIEGKLRQGSVVSISAIARDLNISRTPVTYACLKLEHDKLLTIVPKQGVIINSISVLEAREIYELRAAIEFYSAWRCFASIAQETKQKAHASYERQVAYLNAGDIKGFMKEDIHFHKIFLSVLKNSEFLNIIENMTEKAYLLGLESLKSARRRDENLVEHKNILDRMENGDKVAFAQAIETNILNGLASLTRTLSKT
ncbi:MAG: GntR family transcriptional regulator [Christensenellales bacterium]